MFDIFPISSLERVFMDLPFEAKPLHKATMLKNEYYSFQFAYKLSHCRHQYTKDSLRCSQIWNSLIVKFAGLRAPIWLSMITPPNRWNTLGLVFPDILRPMPKQLWAFKELQKRMDYNQRRKNIESGTYTITATISSGDTKRALPLN